MATIPRSTRQELASLAILEGLPDEQLDWICRNSERIELARGERMFERGQPARALWVVVEGVIQGFEEIGGQWLLVATTSAGEVTGMLPFSRMTHYPRHTVAARPSVVLRFDASRFGELLQTSEELGRRLVAEMTDRVRGDVRLEQQAEKMMALGRLSAGLAHELNNPAAAIRSASARLAEHRSRLPGLVSEFARHHLDASLLEKLQELRASSASAPATDVSALERSAREEELADWLEEREVSEAWEIAASFADTGLSIDTVVDLAEVVPSEALGDVLAWLSVGLESDRITLEIDAAAARISELVGSIKTYSHMDRSRGHESTDVRQGLDSTIQMLSHKLRAKRIELAREYEADLPSIVASPGELNQVWTALIDNAVDAMDEGGGLCLRATRNDIWVEVEVVDSGPGIPEELHAKVFEPFYTTKEVGVGTGLGLGIARRIVSTHQGHIEIRSRPGRTVICVRLPLQRTSPTQAASD